MPIFHMPPNEGPVDELFVFLSEDEAGEGIIGFMSHDGIWTPLVTARGRLVDAAKPIAEHIGKISGKRVKLVKFTTRETLWTPKDQ